MESSVVFDPRIDERSLDKEVSKVDDRLEQTGTITPSVDDSQLGGMGPDGVGGISRGGGGGGFGAATGGATATAGAGKLASKIPKPVAGVAVAAALPVALGGAVGAGMLSAMHASSAQLQTSTDMIGQAWSMFWRPFGNRLDEVFIRDVAQDLLSTMIEFNDLARNQGFNVALNWLGGKAETTFANLMGEAVEDGLQAVGLNVEIAGDVSGVLQAIDWPKITPLALVGAIAWPVIGVKAIIDTMGWPDISAAAFLSPITFPLIPGALVLDQIDFGDVPGAGILDDINFGGIPGVDILEEIFGDINIGKGDLLGWITGGGGGGDGGGDGGGGDTGGPGGGEGDTGPANPIPPPEEPPDTFPGPGSGGGLQRGGVVSRPTRTMVGEAGAEVVQPLSEFERMIERVAASAGGGGEVDMSTVERKLDRLHRDLRALSDVMGSMTIEVDGETLGRATTDARHSKVFDSDSLI